ncbi:MAG: SCO family protein [Planctomycetota bacterium]|nr:SCO family protein [Planctomycetota bacterium]
MTRHGWLSQVMVRATALAACVLSLVLPVASVHAQVIKDELPAQAKGLDFKDRLGQQLPLHLEFTDSSGKKVRLGEYFKKHEEGGKPAIVVMGYYDCPVVCRVVLDKVVDAINELKFKLGEDYQSLYFSFDPEETAARAAEAKTSAIAAYRAGDKAKAEQAWHFHVGDMESNRELARGLGFEYRKLDSGEYSHPVGIYVITPEGKVARVFTGYVYPPEQLRLALLDASEGKIAKDMGDRLMFFCYMYDPKAGAYTLQAVRVMQIAGVLTVIGLAGLIGVMLFGERMKRRARAAALAAAQQSITNPFASGQGPGSLSGTAT